MKKILGVILFGVIGLAVLGGLNNNSKPTCRVSESDVRQFLYAAQRLTSDPDQQKQWVKEWVAAACRLSTPSGEKPDPLPEDLQNLVTRP